MSRIESGSPRSGAGVSEGNHRGQLFRLQLPAVRLLEARRDAGVRGGHARPPAEGTPLGLYVHIPFCRKRCHFCYFKVYTDKDSDEIRGYLDAVLSEFGVCGETVRRGADAAVCVLRRGDAQLPFRKPVAAAFHRAEGVVGVGRSGGGGVRVRAGHLD